MERRRDTGGRNHTHAEGSAERTSKKMSLWPDSRRRRDLQARVVGTDSQPDQKETSGFSTGLTRSSFSSFSLQDTLSVMPRVYTRLFCGCRVSTKRQSRRFRRREIAVRRREKKAGQGACYLKNEKASTDLNKQAGRQGEVWLSLLLLRSSMLMKEG